MTDTRTPLPGDIDRRRFLQGTALAGTAAFLAACGTPPAGSAVASSSAAASEAPSASASASAAATPATSGTLRFANWICYIDESDDGASYPTIEKFQTESGITVEYENGAPKRVVYDAVVKSRA